MLLSAAKLLVRPVLVTGAVLALVATGQAGLSGRPTAPANPSYTLQWGDTLSKVATKYGVPVDQLAAANGITNIHKVIAGTKLTIPTATTAGAQAATPNSASASAIAAASKYATPRMPAALLAHPERLVLAPTFDKWAKAYNVPPDLLKALAWMESGWQNNVVSPVAATGIGQLTPDTVKFVSTQLLKTKLDPKAPDDNIRMSARFISYLLGATNRDVRQALAAYYQGLGSLRRQGTLPVSQAYIAAILALRPTFA